jgi:hypothetical protein
MATQSGITGKIGNIIYYKMGDKYFMRSAPRKYKQTKATKASANAFGKASGIGRIVRTNFSDIIFNAEDRSMQIKLVGKIFSWMQVKKFSSNPADDQFIDLVSFRFSPRAPKLNVQLKEPLRISNLSSSQMRIDIPALIPKDFFNVSPNSNDIGLRIATVMIDIQQVKLVHAFKEEVFFHFDDKMVDEQTIVQDLPVATDCLILTGIALISYVDKTYKMLVTSNKDKVPAQIVHALYI